MGVGYKETGREVGPVRIMIVYWCKPKLITNVVQDQLLPNVNCLNIEAWF